MSEATKVTTAEASFPGRSGVQLFMRRWEPAGVAAPLGGRLVIVHGRGEHGGRYDEVARQIAGSGVAVAALDLRGFGRAGGRRGVVDRFEDYLDDLEDALHYLAGAAPEAKKLLLFGHSFGALVVLRFVQARGGWKGRAPDGLVLSGPFVAKREPVTGLKLLIVRALGRFAPDKALPPSGSEGLTRDAAQRAAYDADPLTVASATPRWFLEVLRAQEEVRRDAARVTCPVLTLQGGADPAADPEGTRTLVAALGSAGKKLNVYDGLLHEVLNELPEARERVRADLVAWVAERVGGAE
ncbi:MAG: lysophospholipase [Planctomycetes bacterium]|nr:lysophospholipase [Planctomycetota bacterium]